MSLPNHISTSARPSEAPRRTLETRKVNMARNWPTSTSMTPEFLSNRVQAQNISISDAYHPRTATDLQQLYHEPCATDMELDTLDSATGSEDYLDLVASQNEPNLLDPRISIFHQESLIYPIGTFNQHQYNIDQVCPWDNGLYEEICDFDTSLIPMQCPLAQLVENQESMDKSLDEHLASQYASSVSTNSGESIEMMKDHSQTKESTNISRGHRVDGVLRRLRQMDHQIRTMHRKQMADIVCSSTV
ncbi:hypothetical protein H0G86_002462 [Trichoderma simmonsii]|uniref:Uncharacterized protein n=1 Tax=Trichoderma simmonsii TaxID=1491479 RepID=A0A8G0L8A0_9HYPO|nr:hypothetical protein H0G86_002462 [Trichoderma simmonsii]